MRDYASAQTTHSGRYKAFFHAMLDQRGLPATERLRVVVRLAPRTTTPRWTGSPTRCPPPPAPPRRCRRERRARSDPGSTSPLGLTTVHLLRHGEVHNPEGVLYGRLPNFRLSEAGQAMAEAAALALRRPPGRRCVDLLPAAARAGDGRPDRAHVRPRDRHRRLRLIEADNVFEGKTFGVGDGSLSRPGHWKHLRNPFRPSWGEPYTQLAARMLVAAASARDAARATGEGNEAVCVSHQLPIWIARRAAEGRRLWHHPGVRQCGLASLTSLTYDGDTVVSVTYSEPAGCRRRARTSSPAPEPARRS